MSYYFDHASVSPVSQEVIQAVNQAMIDHPYSLLQPHKNAQSSIPAVKEALRSIFDFFHLDAHKDQCIITSSAAEATSQIVQSVFQTISRESGKNHFVTAKTDEAAAIMSLGRIEKQGAVISLAETKEGVVTANTLSEALSPRTALVILNHVNGLTGQIHPIEELIKVCRDRGALVAVDVSHSCRYIECDFHTIGADFLIFDSVQLAGPKGIGGFICRNDRHLQPLIAGAAELGQYRAGALNIAYLVGLGVALKKAHDERLHSSVEVARSRRQFEKKLTAKEGVEVLFKPLERVPHISCLSFKGVHQEALNFMLDQAGIQACMGGGSFQQLALNLQSAGVSKEQSYSALSFSFDSSVNAGMINESTALIHQCYDKLSTLSQNLDLEVSS